MFGQEKFSDIDPFEIPGGSWLWDKVVGPFLKSSQISAAIEHLSTAICIILLCYLCSILMHMIGRHQVGKMIKLMGVVLGIKSLFTI